MTAGPADDLPTALRRGLGPQWELARDGDRISIAHRDRGTPYRPPRRVPGWAELLDRLDAAFAVHGVVRATPLPLRWGRDTDLTISAVQAMDPYVKDRKPFTYRSGYLAQPVVRFTGKKDEKGQLLDGFLTSFVNLSQVQLSADAEEHTSVLDDWIGVLSRLGLHARHLEIAGSTNVWRRGPVEGVTLHFRHVGLPLGDVVMLWNADEPSYLVTDLGSGLERLRWAIGQRNWNDNVYGRCATWAKPAVLDAIRTSVLLVSAGIDPSARGPGNAVRRLLRAVKHPSMPFGYAIRIAYGYWSLTTAPHRSWPEVFTVLEHECS